MKTLDSKNTLAYAVCYLFNGNKVSFYVSSQMYQYIKTVYDEREDGRGCNTLAVVYSFKKMKYEVLNVTDEKIGNKEIQIIG